MIDDLNKRAISTCFLQSVLSSDITIDPYTTMVTLDLWLENGVSNYDSAISTIMSLGEKLQGPYFIIVWSRNNFDEFLEEYKQVAIEFKNQFNFPIFIDKIDKDKFTKGVNNPDLLNHIDNIISNKLQNTYIKNLFEFINVNSDYIEKVWTFLRENDDNYDTIESRFDKLNHSIGQLLTTSDYIYNLPPSGKGLLKFKTSLSEILFDVKPIYYAPISEITRDIKLRTNRLIAIHSVNKQFDVGFRPGYIFYDSNNLLKENISFDSKKYFNDSVDNNIFTKDKAYSFKQKTGFLVITPDCDYVPSNGKNRQIILLKIIIVSNSWNDESIEISFIKKKKPNIEIIEISKEEQIIFNPKDLYTIPSNTPSTIDDFHSYYLDKEIVDYIRQIVAKDISRIGTSVFLNVR